MKAPVSSVFPITNQSGHEGRGDGTPAEPRGLFCFFQVMGHFLESNAKMSLPGKGGTPRAGLALGMALFIWTAGALFPLAVGGTPAAAARVEKDSNGDGRVDQIAHMDPTGTLLRLEVDSDRDGRMDSVQQYENGQLVSIERDTDGNGVIDLRETYAGGKRVHQEKFDSKGRPTERIRFDAEERPLAWERDTTGQGRLDSVFHFRDGQLERAVRDRDADGRPDREVLYDPAGRPLSSRHDLDQNGTLETLRSYSAGALVKQQRDTDGDGRPEAVSEYLDGEPAAEFRDTNGDGCFDVTLRIKKGVVTLREEDLDHDGRTDRSTEYDGAGQPVVQREDTRRQGLMDRISRFENGKLVRVEQGGGEGAARKVTTLFRDGRPFSQETDHSISLSR